MDEVMYVTWPEVIDLCYKLAENIIASKYRPDVVVAILRGGVVPALILSDILSVEEFFAIRIKHWGIGRELYTNPIVEQMPQGKLEGKNVLLVDEVADTGKTLIRALNELAALNPLLIKTAVLHVKPSSLIQPDYYAKKCDRWVWIFYPWSLLETLTSLALKDVGSRAASRREVLERAIEVGRKLGVDSSKLEILKNIIDYIQ
ncbi:MAG: phosphoribosyltransferase [Ignisphaera sp.]|nr:phosphoribosyltransferase [Ignisphaera sp.]MCX8168329.1 phosphoribosyltransferase [Ignisphaera sp.]MDW8085338.1 phosphoribosyltransferase [Ignisphaera sp.]